MSIYRKSTFTGLLLDFLSYNPFSYKIALVKTLVHRIYNICNSNDMLHRDITKLKQILARNMYPPLLIDKIIRKFLDKCTTPQTENEEPSNISFYKLPYVRDASERTKKQLKDIQLTYCKSNSIRISFSTFKIGSVFSAKDKLDKLLKSFVVYRYVCPSCNARYVGETTRHLKTRIEEHLNSSSTHISKHLSKSGACRELSDSSCFEIIDSANSEFALKVKEAMHIGWERPNINVQKETVKVTITV